MNEQNATDFIVGDIILHQGEAYQVHKNFGPKGMVAPFPGENVGILELKWNKHCRKIGNEPLPGPTPCSTGDGCPTNTQTIVKFDEH